MSRGPGSVQEWITAYLTVCRLESTIAEMAFAFCKENEIKKSLRLSARHSLTRALRGLVKAGTVKRLEPPRRSVRYSRLRLPTVTFTEVGAASRSRKFRWMSSPVLEGQLTHAAARSLL
jgi:hypothetical protein